LWEIQRYGSDSFGDPDYISIYGLNPEDLYARGIRLLARTAVECTRDKLADLIGQDIAALAGAAPALSGSVVVDPFAGSGNTLFWISRRVSARRSIGFELDDAVFETSRRNLSIAEVDVALFQEAHESGLATLGIPEDQLLIVFVAPPWGDALRDAAGLDLRLTQPPAASIIDLIANTFRLHKVLLAVQVYETVVLDSLADVTARLDWAFRKTYDIDAPGKNHGLILGTLGWTPTE
jgi:16S rRNA G966 N2-methylase RsmD